MPPCPTETSAQSGQRGIVVLPRLFPYRLNTQARRFNHDSIENYFLVSPYAFSNGSRQADADFFNFGNITYNGSFGRSISFGNSQDAVVRPISTSRSAVTWPTRYQDLGRDHRQQYPHPAGWHDSRSQRIRQDIPAILKKELGAHDGGYRSAAQPELFPQFL